MRIGKNHILAGFLIAIVGYLVFHGIYNYFLSEEQKIKKMFYNMASDIEDKSILGFDEYFTDNAKIRYREVDIDARRVGIVILGLMKSYKEIDVSFDELSIEVKGEEAIATFTGEAVDRKLRIRGEFEGTAKLRKVEGEWKIYSATGREHRRPKMVF